MEIKLTSGKSTFIDDADFDLIKGFSWCSNEVNAGKTYVVARMGRKMVKLHRFILGIIDPTIFVDHKDGDTLNNTRSNLRICKHSENIRNSAKRAKASSKYKGVSLISMPGSTGKHHYKYWKVSISINGKSKHIALFKDELEAAKCYDKHAKIHYGEFANINFPEKT